MRRRGTARSAADEPARGHVRSCVASARSLAVDGVDIAVDAGEVVGLVGANGAGKTTLIRVLLGLLAPTSGNVSLFGGPPTREARARVGYVPQSGGLYDDLTVAENAGFRHAGVRRSARVRRLPATWRRSAAPWPPTSRSACGGGSHSRRRCPMRRSCWSSTSRPRESTRLQRSRLWDTIRGAAERGVGVLVTTHHMSEAGQCDRLLVMADGRVVASGTQADIVGDAQRGRRPGDRLGGGFSALDRAGMLVSLSGRNARVLDAGPEKVKAVLDAAQLAAEVELLAGEPGRGVRQADAAHPA